jgi:hypothetical protein
VPGTDGVDEIALQEPGIGVATQLAQLLLIGRAPARNFTLNGINDWKFGETGGNARLGVTGLQRQRLREIGRGLLVAADFQQISAALVPGLGIARIKPQRDREILDRVIGSVEADQHATAILARFGEVRRERQRASGRRVSASITAPRLLCALT